LQNLDLLLPRLQFDLLIALPALLALHRSLQPFHQSLALLQLGFHLPHLRVRRRLISFVICDEGLVRGLEGGDRRLKVGDGGGRGGEFGFEDGETGGVSLDLPFSSDCSGLEGRVGVGDARGGRLTESG
jgi:hypothetical protein